MVGRALRLTAGVILLIGFASAAGIYAASTGEVRGYQPEETKQYLRTLELYGGKANVMATELREWFGSLWPGRRLAYTVGSTLTRNDGRRWGLLARHMEINRVGGAGTTHTLSPTPKKLTDLTVSHTRPFELGELRVGLGYSRLRDEVSAVGNDDSWFGWLEYRIN